MRLDIHVFLEGETREHALHLVLGALAAMEARIMARFDTVQSVLTAIDAATNATAANIQALIDKINATPGDGLDGPQTDAVLTHLEALRDQLTAMAATSANPIPPPVAPPPAL